MRHTCLYNLNQHTFCCMDVHLQRMGPNVFASDAQPELTSWLGGKQHHHTCEDGKSISKAPIKWHEMKKGAG